MPLVQELTTVIERIRSTQFPDNERAVEIKVILPLLSALGWDVHGDKVRYQYRVSGTRSREQGVVDIALFGARGALCFIEAKNTDERLDNHVSQLLGYAFYEGVVLCALTDGREWWLYLPREGGKPETRKFAQMNLGTDSTDLLAEQMQLFLAKNNLESGQAERAGRERLLGKRERDIWKQMLEKPHIRLVETITDCIEQETGIRPSQSRVAALLSETSFDVPVLSSVSNLVKKDDAVSRATQGTSDGTNAPVGKRRIASQKVKGVRLWGEFKEVDTWVSAYVALANELYKRHPDEFLAKAKDIGKKTNKYSWFSYREEECTTPLLSAKFLEDSDPRIFVHIHGASYTLIRKSKKLLETFGYPKDDTNIWEIITEQPISTDRNSHRGNQTASSLPFGRALSNNP